MHFANAFLLNDHKRFQKIIIFQFYISALPFLWLPAAVVIAQCGNADNDDNDDDDYGADWEDTMTSM